MLSKTFHSIVIKDKQDKRSGAHFFIPLFNFLALNSLKICIHTKVLKAMV